MYKGDGSYKQNQTEFAMEESLLELLETEKELVIIYNSSVRAFEKARNNSMRTFDYREDIEKTKEKIDATRDAIMKHCENKLNLKTNIVNILYAEGE